MAWTPPPEPPETEDALLARATSLSGRTLSEVAKPYGWRVPKDFRRHKGWAGQLIELALGASAGSKAEPDFPHLGIELKTIPVSEVGQPYESTFVCTAPLDGLEVRPLLFGELERLLLSAAHHLVRVHGGTAAPRRAAQSN